MDGHEVARKFEKHLMTRRIQALDDVEALRKVAIQLVDLNYGMKEQVIQWTRMGWGPKP